MGGARYLLEVIYPTLREVCKLQGINSLWNDQLSAEPSKLLGTPSLQKAKSGGGKPHSNRPQCLGVPISSGTLSGFGLKPAKRKQNIFSDHFASFFWLTGNFGPFLHVSEGDR